MSQTLDPYELLELLDWQVKATTRQIIVTVVLGIMAGCLIKFAEHSLSLARPLFPMLDQNFGMWQNAFGAITLVIAFAWLAAMMQKFTLLQDCVRKQRVQRRIVEQRRTRDEAAEARRAQREAEKATKDVQANEPVLAGGAVNKQGANRFEY